jgi:hypothetical protein
VGCRAGPLSLFIGVGPGGLVVHRCAMVVRSSCCVSCPVGHGCGHVVVMCSYPPFVVVTIGVRSLVWMFVTWKLDVGLNDHVTKSDMAPCSKVRDMGCGQ